ncbi:MAG: hypothetical protein HRF40_05520 [Nitrososphaera sp.]|jgi:hypothetical protein
MRITYSASIVLAARTYDDDDWDVSMSIKARMATASISFLLTHLTVEQMIITMNKNLGNPSSIIEFFSEATHIVAPPINNQSII